MRHSSKALRAGISPSTRLLWTMLQTGLLMLPLGGCLLSADKPDPALDIPANYDGAPRNPKAAEAALPKLDWWRNFRSGELTVIIEEAQLANLDIAAAVARIVQADAQARISGAALLPTADLGGNASRIRSSQSTSSGGSFGGSEHDNLQASLSASYEIDLWGKNRAALRAAEESAAASRFDKEVVALTTVATAANAYFSVLAAQDRIKVARDNTTSANRVLDLIKQRAAAGTASALDTAQQESVVANLKAAIPPLEQTLKQNRTALAILMARSPEHVRVHGGSLRGIAIPRITPGLPSELLAQPPDIREGEANLAAADADVYNARAQLLPSITLTGEGGYESAVLKTLLRPESAFYTLTAGLTQPIFHGGALLGNVDLQKGKQDELLQTYRKTVITAFGDVENALDAVRQTALRERLQGDVVRASRQAFDLSEQRFREGTIDLVTLLQTQQTLYSAQDVLVQARLAHIQAIVSLYQALGGGWLPKPAEPLKTTDAR
jgi:NodT family efflux transporter outer membrane factor (OMF) lipoprotein